jgi:hypothetical protein
MAREAKVKRNFEVERQGGEYQITIKQARTATIATVFGALLLPLLGGTIASFFTLGSDLWWTFPLMIGLTVFLFWRAIGKDVRIVRVGPKGITVANKLYRYDDVEKLGYENYAAGRIYNANSVRGNAAASAAARGYYIYLVHGTRPVAIASGLDEFAASQLFNKINELCEEYGSGFTAAA